MPKIRGEDFTQYVIHIRGRTEETPAARIDSGVTFDRRLDITSSVYGVGRSEMLEVLGDVENYLVGGPEYAFGGDEGLELLQQTVGGKVDYGVLFTNKLSGLGVPRDKARDLIESYLRELASSDTEARGKRMSPFDLGRLLRERVKPRG